MTIRKLKHLDRVVLCTVLLLGASLSGDCVAEYPKVITNKSLPKPIGSAARQCSADGEKVVFSNLDLTSQGYVYCPEPPKRWAILDSNANELIAPELEVVEASPSARLPDQSRGDTLTHRINQVEKEQEQSLLKAFERVGQALSN